MRKIAIGGAVALCATALPPAHAADWTFSNQTAATGVACTHNPAADTPGLPMVGGASAADFNNDGWPDLFVVGGGGALDRLFINNGNGTFTDQAASWFSPVENQPLLYRGNGAAAGDYNKDGWLDLFVTSFGDMPVSPAPGQHRLYRNNGNGTFTNVAAAAGVNQTAPYSDGFGATFGDYDLDGDLDLWVGGWMFDANGGGSLGNRLFQNNGDGTFTDATVSAGVAETKLQGFGAIFASMDGDRYPELLVAGDFGSSRYYRNDRDGTFTSFKPLLPGETKAYNGMGTSLGDVDRDGDMDWFVTAIYDYQGIEPTWTGSRLYANVGSNRLDAFEQSAGVNDGGWGWGASLQDLDNDGWVDVVHTNGWPNCDAGMTCFLDDASRLFHNNGGVTFTEMGQAIGFDHTGQGRCLLDFDYDLDGDRDIVITTNQGGLYLGRNDLSGADANGLDVVLDTSGYPQLPPNGWGANLTLTSAGSTQTVRMANGSNYLCNSELAAHFGFETATSADLVVEWLSGFRVSLPAVAANQRIVVQAEQPYSFQQVGAQLNLVVQGLRPGEKAVFGSSGATGNGPCLSTFGGLCVDLLNPITLLGTAIADVDGRATLAVNASTAPFFSQVIAKRGQGATASLKSNVIHAK